MDPPPQAVSGGERPRERQAEGVERCISDSEKPRDQSWSWGFSMRSILWTAVIRYWVLDAGLRASENALLAAIDIVRDIQG